MATNDKKSRPSGKAKQTGKPADQDGFGYSRGFSPQYSDHDGFNPKSSHAATELEKMSPPHEKRGKRQIGMLLLAAILAVGFVGAMRPHLMKHVLRQVIQLSATIRPRG